MNELSFRADRLNELMTKRQLNAGQLAYMTKISRTMIYYLQKGKRSTTSGEFVSKLADALGTSMQYLVGETDDDSPNQKKMSTEVADIVTVAEDLSVNGQRRILAICEALLKIEKSADVESIYSEIMDLIARLAEVDGGDMALENLMGHINLFLSGDSSDDDDE